MFKRKIEVRLVKDTKATADSVPTPIEIPEEAIARVARNLVNRVAVGAVAVIGATVVLASAGAIVVNTFNNAQQNKNED